MTRRLFWLAMGVTVGALLMRKLSNAAARLTPQGVAGSLSSALGDLASSLGEFGAEVRLAMAEREAQLRAATGLGGTDTASAPTAAKPVPEYDRPE